MIWFLHLRRSKFFQVTARLRKSPFPQISLETALDLIRQKLQRLEVVSLPVKLDPILIYSLFHRHYAYLLD